MSWQGDYWSLSKGNYASASSRISVVTEGLQLELGLRLQVKKETKFFLEGCSDLRGSGLQYALPSANLSGFSIPGWLSAGYSAGSLLLQAGV